MRGQVTMQRTIERDVMEYDVVIVGARPGGPRLRDPPQATQARPQRLRAREGGERSARTCCPARSSSRARSTSCCPAGATSFQGICVPAGDDEFSFLTQTKRYQAADAAADEQSRQLHRLARQPASSYLGAQGRGARRATCSPGFAAAAPLFDEQGAVAGVRIGDMGLDKDGKPGREFRAGPRDPREDDDPRRGLPRQHLEGTDPALPARRRQVAADLRPRLQGTVAAARGPRRARPDPAHGRLPDGQPAPTAAASCTTSTRTACTSASSSASTTPIRASSRSRRSSSSRTTRRIKRAARRRRAAHLRRAHHRRGRLAVDADARHAGRAAGRRRRRHAQRAEDQGRAPGVRCGVLAAEHLVETRQAPRASTSAGARRRAAANSTRSATSARASSTACGSAWRTAHSRRSPAATRRGRSRTTPTTPRSSASTSTPRPTAAGASARCKPRDRLSAVFFAGNTHEEAQPVHLKVADTTICATRCATGVRQSLPALLPGARLRDGGRRRGRQAPADQRVELRALQGLRHQGPVRDHHLDHARGRVRARTTRACRRRPRMTEPIWTPSPRARRGVEPDALRRIRARAPRRAAGRLRGALALVGRRARAVLDRRSWSSPASSATPGTAPVLQHRDRMPGAIWFEDTRLNFAENLLARDDDHAALVFAQRTRHAARADLPRAARRGRARRGRPARARHRPGRPRRRLPAEPAGSRHRHARHDQPRRRLDVVLARLRHQRRARPLRPDRAARAVHRRRLLLRRQDARFAGADPRRARADCRRSSASSSCPTSSRAPDLAGLPHAVRFARVRPPRRAAASSSACRSTRRSTSCIRRAPPACRSASCTASAARCCSTSRNTCCTPT